MLGSTVSRGNSRMGKKSPIKPQPPAYLIRCAKVHLNSAPFDVPANNIHWTTGAEVKRHLREKGVEIEKKNQPSLNLYSGSNAEALIYY